MLEELGGVAAGQYAFIADYITQVEQWLKTANVVENRGQSAAGAQNPPVVLLGADVELSDPEDGRPFSVRLVPPHQFGRAQARQQLVSVLSPLGRALLLAPIGSRITVGEAPTATTYQVLAAAYPEEI